MLLDRFGYHLLLSFLVGLSSGVGLQHNANANCYDINDYDACSVVAQAVSSTEMDDYSERIQNEINGEWTVNTMSAAGEASVGFLIQRDGSIEGLEIVESSGNSDFDTSVLNAIRTAAPFDPLPDSFLPSQLQFQIQLGIQESAGLPPEYMQAVESNIGRVWSSDIATEPRETTVEFGINRDGSVSSLKVLNSSGDSDFDRLALSAISDAAPFDRLPEDYPDDVLSISYVLSTSGAPQPSVPERLQAYDCLEVGEIRSRSSDRLDPGNYRNDTIILDADVINNCDQGFEVAAWRANIYPADSDFELGGKTALVRSLMPGETETMSFYIKFGDLDWTNEYTPNRIVTEGFTYNIVLSSLTPMDE